MGIRKPLGYDGSFLAEQNMRGLPPKVYYELLPLPNV